MFEQDMIERELELGVRKPDAGEVKIAKRLLEKAADPKRLNMEEIYAQETVRIADYPATVRVKIQTLRVGDLGIVAIPCEVFAEIGLEIKKRSPLKSTFIVALANGYNGYLPTPKQHEPFPRTGCTTPSKTGSDFDSRSKMRKHGTTNCRPTE